MLYVLVEDNHDLSSILIEETNIEFFDISDGYLLLPLQDEIFKHVYAENKYRADIYFCKEIECSDCAVIFSYSDAIKIFNEINKQFLIEITLEITINKFVDYFKKNNINYDFEKDELDLLLNYDCDIAVIDLSKDDLMYIKLLQ